MMVLVQSHPTMGAWIEIFKEYEESKKEGSHPTMGAWIEICYSVTKAVSY